MTRSDCCCLVGDPWTVGGCVGTLAIYLVEDGELERSRAPAGRRGCARIVSRGLSAAHRNGHPRGGGPRCPAAYRAGCVCHIFCGRAGMVDGRSGCHAMKRADGIGGRPRGAAGPARDTGTGNSCALGTPIAHLAAHRGWLSVEEVGLADGVAKTSVYERFDRIKERFGLPPNASIADVMMLAVYFGIRRATPFPAVPTGVIPDFRRTSQIFRKNSGCVRPNRTAP